MGVSLFRRAGLGRMIVLAAGSNATAQDADLAKELSNPVASLIRAPSPFNYDADFGPDDGSRVLMNFQPVVPTSIGEDWNIISRTILPITCQEDIGDDAGTQFGLGDTAHSLFLSPKEPEPDGLIWGLGRCSLCRRPQTTFSAAASGARGRRSRSSNPTGHTAFSPTRSGPPPAARTATTSTPPSCSRSSLTPRRMPRHSRSSPRAAPPTPGRRRSTRRSASW